MLTILIADDEKLERNGIKFLLKREKEEFQILEAVNGKDALGVLASHHIDLLLTDVKMPYMNGLELSAHVKENYPEVEIVIFSGYNDFTYAREALRYGVVDYVLKPVDPEEFHKTMSRVTEHIRERMADRERQDRQGRLSEEIFPSGVAVYGERAQQGEPGSADGGSGRYPQPLHKDDPGRFGKCVFRDR